MIEILISPRGHGKYTAIKNSLINKLEDMYRIVDAIGGTCEVKFTADELKVLLNQLRKE